MKKFPVIPLSLLCSFLFTGVFVGHAWADTAASYQYRSQKPAIEISPELEDDSASFRPVHLRPPERLRLIPPAAIQKPPPSDIQWQPEKVESPAIPPQPEKPRYLLKPFFTAAPEAQEKTNSAVAKKTNTASVAPQNAPVKTEKSSGEIKDAQKPIEQAEPTLASDVKPPESTKTPEQSAVVPLHSDLSLAFDKNSSTLSAEAEKSINAVVSQMNDLPDTRLQIRAYATGEEGNPSSARRMALSRALVIRAYMTEKGVKPVRLDVRALGAETDKTPIDRVDLVFAR